MGVKLIVLAPPLQPSLARNGWGGGARYYVEENCRDAGGGKGGPAPLCKHLGERNWFVNGSALFRSTAFGFPFRDRRGQDGRRQMLPSFSPPPSRPRPSPPPPSLDVIGDAFTAAASIAAASIAAAAYIAAVSIAAAPTSSSQPPSSPVAKQRAGTVDGRAKADSAHGRCMRVTLMLAVRCRCLPCVVLCCPALLSHTLPAIPGAEARAQA